MIFARVDIDAVCGLFVVKEATEDRFTRAPQAADGDRQALGIDDGVGVVFAIFTVKPVVDIWQDDHRIAIARVIDGRLDAAVLCSIADEEVLVAVGSLAGEVLVPEPVPGVACCQ